MRRVAFLLLALLVLGGCGGGSDTALTREEYASKADAICTKYNEQTNALPRPANLSDLGESADKTRDILDNAVDDLKDLKPPAREQATADQWIAAVEQLEGDLEEIRDGANEHNMAAVQAVVPRATEHNKRANELATQLGLTVCNKD